MEQRKNFLALILLDALDDENEDDIFRILDKNGVDAGYVPQERGISPLHYSCGMENTALALRVTQRFLEAGAEPNVRSEENMTPLHVAALNGRQEIVAMLLQHNAKLDVMDDERKTPVHYAIEECHFEVVQLMRDHILGQKAKDKQERVRQKALEDSTLSQTKFENSLQQRLAAGKAASTPQKAKNVTFELAATKSKPTALLAVPQAPLEEASAKGTPQRLSYNYDVTSPYYINITHRRHHAQPKFPSPSESVPENRHEADKADDHQEVGSASPSLAEQSLVALSPPQTQRINLFSLTKENLEEFSRLTPEQHSTRLSLINTWRSKVQKSRARQSILKEFDDVSELVDEVMASEHLNFSNTRLKETKQHDEDVDSGACSSAKSEMRRETPSPPAKGKSSTCNLSLGQLIEQVARAHLVDMEPPPQHTPSPPCQQVADVPDDGDDDDEAESSYQTVPDGPKPMVHLQVPQERHTTENPVANSSNFIRSPKSNEYFLQMTEAYVHTDDENGLVFYETKLLANQGNVMAQEKREGKRRHGPALRHDHLDTTATSQSTNFTIPLDYETDALRAELTTFGEPPGPITKSTKRLYIKRLIKYKRKAPTLTEPHSNKENRNEQKFSVELYRTLRSPEFFAKIKDYARYETESSAYFTNHHNKREMREGHLKQSFIYMLIDPRISCNLPGESVFLDKLDVWQRFLRSIFYVGKGKTTRPYCHLYDAMKTHSRLHGGQKGATKRQPLNVEIFKSPPPRSSDSKKLDRILDIWANARGVVCLHVFHNIMPAEAYTREAAIIEALSLRHLTNVKRGDFYGPAKTWTMKEKKYLGIVLLYKAMQIYLAEGESQLSPSDLI